MLQFPLSIAAEVAFVFGVAIKGKPVDHCADDDAASHKLADGVANVSVVAPKPVNPANHEGVTGPQLVEQAPTLGAVGARLLNEPRCSCRPNATTIPD